MIVYTAGSPRLYRWIAVGLVAAASATACSDATGPQRGGIRVSVETTGGDLDNDGYRLLIGANRVVNLGPHSAIVDSVDVGTYDVRIDGIADNCMLDGDPVQTVNVSGSEIASVHFDVGCAATGVAVTVETTGADRFIQYFNLKVDNQSGAVPLNGTVEFTRLQPDSHTILLDTPSNCTANGENPATVNVSNRAVTLVAFGITCAPVLRNLAFTYAGTSLDTRVVIANASGLNSVTLASGHDASWSPDRTKVGLSTQQCDSAWIHDYYDSTYYYGQHCTGGLQVIEVSTGSLLVSLAGGTEPAWSPDGGRIASIGFGGELIVTVVTGAGMVTSEDKPYVLWFMQTTGARNPSWSPDGQRIAFGCDHDFICLVDADGTGLVRLGGTAGTSRNPSWSPDGSMIAFSTNQWQSGEEAIAVISIGGSDVRRLGAGFDPAWSPDGTQLVFARADGLYVSGIDGTGVTRITNGPHSAPDWR